MDLDFIQDGDRIFQILPKLKSNMDAILCKINDNLGVLDDFDSQKRLEYIKEPSAKKSPKN